MKPFTTKSIVIMGSDLLTEWDKHISLLAAEMVRQELSTNRPTPTLKSEIISDHKYFLQETENEDGFCKNTVLIDLTDAGLDGMTALKIKVFLSSYANIKNVQVISGVRKKQQAATPQEEKKNE